MYRRGSAGLGKKRYSARIGILDSWRDLLFGAGILTYTLIFPSIDFFVEQVLSRRSKPGISTCLLSLSLSDSLNWKMVLG